MPDDDVVRRIHERAREEGAAASLSREAEEESRRRRELDFVWSIRSAVPALLAHCEDDLRPYFFIERKTALFRTRYEAVDSAVWILAAYSYTIGMREEHKTDEFGLTHDGVFFDTRNGYSLSERSLSDNETADRFRPGHTCYSGAVQRAQGLCKKAGVSLPDFS